MTDWSHSNSKQQDGCTPRRVQDPGNHQRQPKWEPTRSVCVRNFLEWPKEGARIATITEEALRGEWFYLEEEQPLDLSSPSFYILAASRITPNDRPGDVGSYLIEDGNVVIQFPRYARAALTIVLTCDAPTFGKGTDLLTANASYEIAAVDEPLHYYGTFVRRRADYRSTPGTWRRIS